jgi:signal transduction histidine kinase/ActR/RegA family two-component response regulator
LTTFTVDEKNFTQLIIRDIGERKKIEEALVELNKTLEHRVAQRTEELENAYAQLLQQNVHYRELAKRLTQAEEQERKRISRLLHDNHQQLIAAARMRVEMLQSGSHDPGVQNATQQVLEILGQAAEITRSLTLELSPPILFGSGLVVAIKSLARRMEKEHQLEVIVLGSLPSTGISTDVSDALFRAVREFLFNVVKHADAREARVNIALFDQHLVLTVEDEGVGFDASGTLESLGGYGLFSIQEQLSFLDGRLHISSASNRGTTCTVSIPMVTEDASNLEIWPAVDSITIENTEMLQIAKDPIRILVVDDHEVARKALVQILTLAEYFSVVGEAIDGLDAIEKTRTLKPDVILMDVTMPKMNGVEATRSIMKEFPGLKVIGLSMHGSEEMESYMLAAGATSYLQKLTPVEQLFDTIRGVMNKESVGPH